MSNVEHLFKYPKDEIRRMESDYQTLFGSHLANFIKTEAKIISSQYHDQCAHILVDRFIEINKVAEKLPSQPSKKQYDKFVQHILSLAEPSEIAGEMELVVNNDDIYDYYRDFLKRSDQDAFHQLYMKCSFPKNTVLLLNQLAMVQIKESIDQLNNYIKSLQSHNKLIKQIQEKRKDDSILKTGASIIGLGLGIPFLGMGLGALLSSGDKQKIQQSLGNIFNNIDFLEESLYKTVDKLGESIYLLFLTLIGGTFISVNNALKTQNIYIEKMTEENVVIYSLTPEEKKKFENWFQVSITGITALVKEKQWHEAIRIVKEMHQIIADKPIHSYHEILPGKSALYIAHVYYYAVYQEALLAEYRAGHIESFLKQSQAFLDTLILYPLEKDFPAFAANPSVFLFLYVKQSMSHRPNQLYWSEKASEYISKRHENIVLMGEYGENPKDYAKNMTHFFIVAQFYDEINKTGFIKSERKYVELMYQAMTDEKINQLIAIDQLFNHPDQFSDFLQTLSSRTKKAKRAPFIRWSVRLIVATSMIALLLIFSKPLISKLGNTTNIIGEKLSQSVSYVDEKWEDLKFNTSEIWSSIFQNDEVTEDIQQLGTILITEPTVNIRETPSLNGKVIATGYTGETYSFLNEEQVDVDGVTWLTIKLADGETAYISKKVAKIQ